MSATAASRTGAATDGWTFDGYEMVVGLEVHVELAPALAEPTMFRAASVLEAAAPAPQEVSTS